MSKAATANGRTRARELMVQALYQKQIGGHSCSELLQQFREDNNYTHIDQAFFEEVFPALCSTQAELESTIADIIDRPLDQLDPIEFGILLIGVYELEARIDIPYRVVINESINLAKRFGALDGHKYINACLDKAAVQLRKVEVDAKGRG